MRSASAAWLLSRGRGMCIIFRGVSLPTSSLAGAMRKCLGRYPEEGSLIAVFDELHWQSKRDHQPKAPEPVDTDTPFDASRSGDRSPIVCNLQSPSNRSYIRICRL